MHKINNSSWTTSWIIADLRWKFIRTSQIWWMKLFTHCASLQWWWTVLRRLLSAPSSRHSEISAGSCRRTKPAGRRNISALAWGGRNEEPAFWWRCWSPKPRQWPITQWTVWSTKSRCRKFECPRCKSNWAPRRSRYEQPAVGWLENAESWTLLCEKAPMNYDHETLDWDSKFSKKF